MQPTESVLVLGEILAAILHDKDVVPGPQHSIRNSPRHR